MDPGDDVPDRMESRQRGWRYPAMATETAPTTLVDRVWNEAVESGEVDVIDDALTDDYVGHTPGAPGGIRGPDGFKQYVRTLREAFPDLAVTIDDRLVTEEAIVDRYTMRGTHEGSFKGIPPTDTEIEFTGIVIHYVENGKVRKDVSEFDVLDVMQQLDVVESPGE